MKQIKNIAIKGKFGKPITLDVYFEENGIAKPILIFAHGFKGFKDWGHWDAIGEEFVKRGFVFLKFNFSHNGTTPEHPLDFADLEAFGQNNYSKEMRDLKSVVDWAKKKGNIAAEECNTRNIYLIGHSRGGGIAVLYANKDKRIKKLVTWAAVDSLNRNWTFDYTAKWKNDEVVYILNGRTKQQMPLYYQLYEDFIKNIDELNVQSAAEELNKPFLIIHGNEDPAVSHWAAKNLYKWNTRSELQIIEGANHVFGGRHPFEGDKLPVHSRKLVDLTSEFLLRG